MAYFPNGSSGEVFDAQCMKCRYGDGPCPIFYVQSNFNYDACNNEVATKILDELVKEDGTCTMFAMDPGHFANDRPAEREAEAAYLALTKDTPASIRELVLKAAGRIA